MSRENDIIAEMARTAISDRFDSASVEIMGITHDGDTIIVDARCRLNASVHEINLTANVLTDNSDEQVKETTVGLAHGKRGLLG